MRGSATLAYEDFIGLAMGAHSWKPLGSFWVGFPRFVDSKCSFKRCMYYCDHHAPRNTIGNNTMQPMMWTVVVKVHLKQLKVWNRKNIFNIFWQQWQSSEWPWFIGSRTYNPEHVRYWEFYNVVRLSKLIQCLFKIFRVPWLTDLLLIKLYGKIVLLFTIYLI